MRREEDEVEEGEGGRGGGRRVEESEGGRGGGRRVDGGRKRRWEEEHRDMHMTLVVVNRFS